jgi:hypothetical protein
MENTCDWQSRLLAMMLVKERDPGGGGALVSVWDKFAVDSPLEESGFELVWGFSCQVVVFGLLQFFVRSGKAVLRSLIAPQVSRRLSTSA